MMKKLWCCKNIIVGRQITGLFELDTGGTYVGEWVSWKTVERLLNCKQASNHIIIRGHLFKFCITRITRKFVVVNCGGLSIVLIDRFSKIATFNYCTPVSHYPFCNITKL